MKLALEELHAALVVFILHDDRVGDIIALVEYAFMNTSGADDPLRELIGEYMALEAGKLANSAEFNAFVLQEGGQIYGEWMKRLAPRIT